MDGIERLMILVQPGRAGGVDDVMLGGWKTATELEPGLADSWWNTRALEYFKAP